MGAARSGGNGNDMTMMTHRGYKAVARWDADAALFHGEVLNLRDVVTFQGRTMAELKRAFAESIADWLAFCREDGGTVERSSLEPPTGN
jgi:predicted HicB family RNase H-like nuclease